MLGAPSRGGCEGRDLDAATLTQACEELGAGEILLNCIDKDGTNSGFDLELIKLVKDAVTIPVIASSGAGKPEHFSEVFTATGADAALTQASSTAARWRSRRSRSACNAVGSKLGRDFLFALPG